MSDVNFYGVLKMPYELAMSDELSRWQFYKVVQEAVKRLEALEQQDCSVKQTKDSDIVQNSEQPAQEPVAWIMLNEDGREIAISDSMLGETQPKWVQELWETAEPLYTHPHQDGTSPSKWNSLTDDEIDSAWNEVTKYGISGVDFTVRFARAIEQELKTKNGFSDIKEKNHG